MHFWRPSSGRVRRQNRWWIQFSATVLGPEVRLLARPFSVAEESMGSAERGSSRHQAQLTRSGSGPQNGPFGGDACVPTSPIVGQMTTVPGKLCRPHSDRRPSPCVDRWSTPSRLGRRVGRVGPTRNRIQSGAGVQVLHIGRRCTEDGPAPQHLVALQAVPVNAQVDLGRLYALMSQKRGGQP